MATKFREIDEPDVPVPAEKLIVGARLPCDIFIKDNGAIKPMFNKDALFTSISKNILLEKGISEVYLYMKDSSAFDLYQFQNSSLRDSRHVDHATVFKEYSFYKDQHHQIDCNLLIPGTKIHFSLFVLSKLSFIPLIIATGKSPAEVDERVLTTLGDVVIKKADVPLYYDYVNSLMQYPEALKENRLKIKSLAIKENSKVVIKNLLDDPRSGQKIKELKPLVQNMIDCILEDNDAIYDLLSLRGYDYYTYTHSVNVAALSIGIGIAAGLKNEDAEKLGIGAMLHDIGKSAISHDILNKQGKLDDNEYRLIKSHVTEGEKILRMYHREFPAEALSAVLQHHEKLSGKGYPFKLAGEDIKLFGRMAAIADCYDALTTQRPYKPAFTPFYALSIIAKETGDYDPDLLKLFIKMLGRVK
ncbi:MAG: HD-GYP domain-containing protein [Nitrospirae bacterium]|nr:HD-GYP domain-containing protein [Nitrospirota bacterium]